MLQQVWVPGRWEGKGREEVGERTSVASPEVAMEGGRMMGWLVGLGDWTAGLVKELSLQNAGRGREGKMFLVGESV